jgi:hypothetical protein
MRKSLLLFIALLIISSLTLSGCGSAAPPPASQTTAVPPAPTASTPPPPATALATTPPNIAPATSTPPTTLTKIVPPPAFTPPPTITGLSANNAYDGKVNLRWDISSARDFDHYNIYVAKTGLSDVTGITAAQQVKDISICTCQISGLEDGASYYFAVTAVNKSQNENTQVTGVSTKPVTMLRGTVDPDIVVDVYQSDKAWAGTTLLVDNHSHVTSRIIEINMLGEIIWQYMIPADLKNFTNPGFDAEVLANNNILFVLPGKGVYEIDRSGKTVWSYLTAKISHDADRLSNGNTIYVFGNNDQKSDAQVTEVNPAGQTVWQWYARDYFDVAPYSTVSSEGWTHTNAITRLDNGNTLISLRNFNFVVEVDPSGAVVAKYGEDVFVTQHDPVLLPNGDLLVANQDHPHQALELNLATGEVVWKSLPADVTNIPVRDADRLPNGNILVTGSTRIYEVTPDNVIVWELILDGISLSGPDAASYGFYKSQRLTE